MTSRIDDLTPEDFGIETVMHNSLDDNDEEGSTMEDDIEEL